METPVAPLGSSRETDSRFQRENMESLVRAAELAVTELLDDRRVSKAERAMLRVLRIGLMGRSLPYSVGVAKAVLGHLRWRTEVAMRVGILATHRSKRKGEAMVENAEVGKMEKEMLEALRGSGSGGKGSMG